MLFCNFAFLAQQLIALRHHGQRRAVILLIALFASQQRAPACLRQKARFGDKLAASDIQLDNALPVNRVRTELHQILAGDQVVNIGLIVRQAHGTAARRGDNGMVSVNFFIVPAAIFTFGIKISRRFHCRLMRANGIQHRMAPGKMLLRQIAAVRTRIGDQLVGLIKTLTGIQHRLRAEAVAFRRLYLQAGERKRQRCRIVFPPILIVGHPRRFSADARQHMLRQRTMQQSPLFILPGFAGVAGLPKRDETLLFGRHDMRFDFKVIFGNEVLDLFIAPHHQPQHRRLHPADRQYAVIAGVAAQQRPCAGHIDAVQPVGARARQRRDAQRNKFFILAQATHGTFHRLRVKIVD